MSDSETESDVGTGTEFDNLNETDTNSEISDVSYTSANQDIENNNRVQTRVYVNPDNFVTSDAISNFEAVSIISQRAEDIANGSKVFTDVSGISCPIKQATKELLDKKCPLKISRKVGKNKFELWDVNKMILNITNHT